MAYSHRNWYDQLFLNALLYGFSAFAILLLIAISIGISNPIFPAFLFILFLICALIVRNKRNSLKTDVTANHSTYARTQSLLLTSQVLLFFLSFLLFLILLISLYLKYLRTWPPFAQ